MRAFGARIHAVNTSGRTSEPVGWVGPLDQLGELLSEADVLVVAIPLTAATRGLIGARELGLMKSSAILVNVARGPLIDERALYEHLRANPGFSAAIDAWWDEPSGRTGFRTGYPFFALPNLLGSPHNSGSVPGIMEMAARRAARTPPASCAASTCPASPDGPTTPASADRPAPHPRRAAPGPARRARARRVHVSPAQRPGGEQPGEAAPTITTRWSARSGACSSMVPP